MQLKIMIIAMSFMFLSACASMPTQQELNSADYGAYPDDYEQIVKSYLLTTLKDPYSAQYEFIGGPQRQWARFMTKTDFGYGVCYRINAKNSFGGYTGFKMHHFLIHNGVIVQHIHETNERYDIMGQIALERCANTKREPKYYQAPKDSSQGTTTQEKSMLLGVGTSPTFGLEGPEPKIGNK